jgi:hypothetical protein
MHMHMHMHTHMHAHYTHTAKYLVDLHEYIDNLEQQNEQLHADIKLALAHVQEHHMTGIEVQELQEEIVRVKQSEALLARQVSDSSKRLGRGLDP